MSTADEPPGPGWWKASDGRWYPPESAAPPPLGVAYGAPMPQPTAGRTNPMAITSLVLGVLSLFLCGFLAAIPGLITGVTARRQIRESNGAEEGDGLAIGGIATSTVGLAISVLAVGAIIAITFAGRSATSAFGPIESVNPTTTLTTTSVAPASAAGKPCVAMSDPLPTGAPAVPVEVGPPPTGLVTKDLVVGTGPAVAPGATVTVDYIGLSCSTGKIIDSSYERGQPATFSLDQVIPGWTEGLVGMQVGGRRLLGIPPDLAYGSSGSPPSVSPDETLWFVVELNVISP